MCLCGISKVRRDDGKRIATHRRCQYLNETTAKCNNSHQNMMIGNQTAGNRLKRSNYSCNFDCSVSMTGDGNGDGDSNSSLTTYTNPLIKMSLPNY